MQRPPGFAIRTGIAGTEVAVGTNADSPLIFFTLMWVSRLLVPGFRYKKMVKGASIFDTTHSPFSIEQPMYAAYLIFAKPAVADVSAGFINKATWNNNLASLFLPMFK